MLEVGTVVAAWINININGYRILKDQKTRLVNESDGKSSATSTQRNLSYQCRISSLLRMIVSFAFVHQVVQFVRD